MCGASSRLAVKKSNTFCMNLLQVYIRQRELTSKEKDELLDIRERNHGNLDFSAGVAALLGHQEDYNYFVRKMGEAQRNKFLSYPIAGLLKYMGM